MEVKVYEGKELETILEEVKEDLQITDNDFVYKKEEIKGSLLKKGSTKVYVYSLTDIQEYAKDILSELTKGMGIETTFESKIRENQITIKMYSNNNIINNNTNINSQYSCSCISFLFHIIFTIYRRISICNIVKK